MRSTIFRIGFSIVVLSLVAASAVAQGRSRGRGSDVFFDRHNARNSFEGRGRDQNWKCGKFVNCHDARNGRWDGRGPNRNFARGANVGYRRRYNMNDYWQRRHLTYRTNDLSSRWRYRNRMWRER
jgi:hypothetical protein